MISLKTLALIIVLSVASQAHEAKKEANKEIGKKSEVSDLSESN